MRQGQLAPIPGICSPHERIQGCRCSSTIAANPTPFSVAGCTSVRWLGIARCNAQIVLACVHMPFDKSQAACRWPVGEGKGPTLVIRVHSMSMRSRHVSSGSQWQPSEPGCCRSLRCVRSRNAPNQLEAVTGLDLLELQKTPKMLLFRTLQMS